jgi:hypothetical protein
MQATPLWKAVLGTTLAETLFTFDFSRTTRLEPQQACYGSHVPTLPTMTLPPDVALHIWQVSLRFDIGQILLISLRQLSCAGHDIVLYYIKMPGGLHPPLEVLLSWPAPNFINPQTKPNTITILACILGPVTVGMLLARLWVRIFHQRKPGWDDWLMLAAIVSSSQDRCFPHTDCFRYQSLL